MRDDGLPRLPASGPTYRITKITDNPSNWTARYIHGEMTVPLYMTSPFPVRYTILARRRFHSPAHFRVQGSHLVLDSNGLPVFQGFANATFSVQIPKSLVVNGTAGRIVQYGHGLFGNQDEIQTSYLQVRSSGCTHLLLGSAPHRHDVMVRAGTGVQFRLRAVRHQLVGPR